MKRLGLLFLPLALVVTTSGALAVPVPAASPAPAVSPAAPGTAVTISGGTPVDVSFVQQVSSDTAKEGTEVPVQVTQEVDVNGMMVIAKGAQGQATLTKVLHSGGNGSGGKIEFSVDWVTAVDGSKVPLSQVNHSTANADRKGAASTMAIVGWATLGILGLFSHNIVHGNAAIIKPDKVFDVFVDHTVNVNSAQAATAAPATGS